MRLVLLRYVVDGYIPHRGILFLFPLLSQQGALRSSKQRAGQEIHLTLSLSFVEARLWSVTFCVAKTQQFGHVHGRLSFDPGMEKETWRSIRPSDCNFFSFFFIFVYFSVGFEQRQRGQCSNPLDCTHSKCCTETNSGYLLNRFSLWQDGSVYCLCVPPYLTKPNV